MEKDFLDLYVEYNKFYSRYLDKLMKASNKKRIEKTKSDFKTVANDYIAKFTKDTNDTFGIYYSQRINDDIKGIDESF